MCSEKSEHNCLTSYWYTAAILARFFLFVCLRRCFSLTLSNGNKKKPYGNQQKTRLEASKPPTVFTIALSGGSVNFCFFKKEVTIFMEYVDS